LDQGEAKGQAVGESCITRRFINCTLFKEKEKGRTCSRNYRLFVRKPEGKRPLGRS
jgi:hypothetical protein